MRCYADILRELGEDADLTLVASGDYSVDAGISATNRLLDRAPDIDAIFAASDQMAIGAMTALRRRGLRVPEDVAVAGFDDSGAAAVAEPPLTTIRQPWDDLSSEMVRTLCELIAQGEVESVVLPTTLVVRDSA